MKESKTVFNERVVTGGERGRRENDLLSSGAKKYLRERGFFEGTQIPHHCGDELGKHGWTSVFALMAGFAEQAIKTNKGEGRWKNTLDLSGDLMVRYVCLDFAKTEKSLDTLLTEPKIPSRSRAIMT